MKLNSEMNPDFEDAKNRISQNIGKRVIVIFTRCSVTFRGKFSTDLSHGDRLVIIKEDKTCMVHSVDKRKPRNWQTSGAKIEVNYNNEEDNEFLELDTWQVGSNEKLKIKMFDIYELSVYNAVDNAELEKEGTEEDMKQYIWDNPEDIIEENLRIIDDEVACPDGDIDLLGVDNENRKTVIEIKRRKGVKEHVRQLESYTRYYRNEIDADTRGILIAPNISSGAKERLKNKDLEFIPLHPMESLDASDREETKITDFQEEG